MAAPLSRARGCGALTDALVRIAQALLQGAVVECRGLPRVAARRAVSRLLEAFEALGARADHHDALDKIELALLWLELAERAARPAERHADVRECRARLTVLARRVGAASRGRED